MIFIILISQLWHSEIGKFVTPTYWGITGL